jgi:hypothetical protein
MKPTMRSIWGSHATTTHDSTTSKVDRQDQEIEELTRRVDRLSLACQALWELLRDRIDLDDATLNRKISEIDLRDGSSDGRIAMAVIECEQCGNRGNSRRKQCIFCGAALRSKHTFS